MRLADQASLIESKGKGKVKVPIPGLYADKWGCLVTRIEGLAGGTPLRFGGSWDVVSEKVERYVDPNKPQKVVKKGPHDCYCDVGYNCWSMAGCAAARAQTMPPNVPVTVRDTLARDSRARFASVPCSQQGAHRQLWIAWRLRA